MKKMMSLLLLLVWIKGNAQNITLRPVYFPGKDLTGVDSFRYLVQNAIGNYHLIKLDSTINRVEWDKGHSFSWFFEYTNGEYYNNVPSNIKLNFYFRAYEGQPDIRKPYKFDIDRIQITGDFIALVSIYNAIFNSNLSPSQVQSLKPKGAILYSGANKYWFNFDLNMQGWYMLFSKK